MFHQCYFIKINIEMIWFQTNSYYIQNLFKFKKHVSNINSVQTLFKIKNHKIIGLGNGRR